MAEATALFVLEKIASALVTEGVGQIKSLYKSVQEVHTQMRDIKWTLELMQAILNTADKQASENEVAAKWVKRTRDLAFKIENLVDEYSYIMRPRELLDFKRLKDIKALNGIAQELNNMNATLRTHWEDKKTFDVNIMGKGALKSNTSIVRRETECARTITDDQIIGVEEQKKELKEWLNDDDDKTSLQRRVIAVQGMGGVGKTTLVANVYKDCSTNFEYRAWVTVSQSYNIDDILRKVITSLHEGSGLRLPQLEAMNTEKLHYFLREFLKDKRYLIIIDDVWDPIFWIHFKTDIISKDNKKSRVIITTRSQDVARVADTTLKLTTLNDADSMALFELHANIKHSELPQTFQDLAKEIVKMCGALPLALVWVGNLIAHQEPTQIAWTKVRDVLTNVGEHSEDDEIKRINAILGLSIDNLPCSLRNCFLYCSIFPEDYLFERKRLLRLWVSEGFISKESSWTRTKIEIAEDCLTQLVDRSMFQVVERNYFGQIKAFKIHDIVRNMIVEKQRAESFYDQLDDSKQRQPVMGTVRYLSVSNLEDENGLLKLHVPQLRSFHCFGNDSLQELRIHAHNFKLLRVLNFDGTMQSISLPDEVCNLFNLHYLSFHDVRSIKLPKDLRRLKNLETLELWVFPSTPGGLSELNRLQHLIGYGIQGSKIKKIRNLRHLQTLKTIRATDDLVHELGSLSELRTLHVELTNYEQSKALAVSIAKLKNLLNLQIKMDVELDPKSLFPMKKKGPGIQLDDGLTSLPSQLQKLKLRGKIYSCTLPQCLDSSNLAFLELSNNKLEQDPVPSLAHKLPNLLGLCLWNCCKSQVRELVFPNKSFPKLKTLRMVCMKVEKITFLNESLVALEMIRLSDCDKLNNLPVGIENLSNVKQLFTVEMTEAFVEELRQQKRDVESSKIKNIPHIIHRRVVSDDAAGYKSLDEKF